MAGHRKALETVERGCGALGERLTSLGAQVERIGSETRIFT
jgi:hypothetical protein